MDFEENLLYYGQVFLFIGIFAYCLLLDFILQKIGFDLLYSSIGSLALFVATLDGLTTYLFLELGGCEGNFLPSFLINKIGKKKGLLLLYLIFSSAILWTLFENNLRGVIGLTVIATGGAIWNILYSISLQKPILS